MRVYVDAEHRCHIANPYSTYRAVETEFFDGKCATFIEGYCYKEEATGVVIYPWKLYSELDAAQREYERQLLAEYESALANSIPINELETAYQEGVDSI